MATTIEDLEERLNTFEQSLIQMGINQTPVVDKVDATANKVDITANRVDSLTPYTETKTAYYGEKEKTFYGVPQGGNVTVMFDNYKGNYSVSRIMDRVTVSFDTLTDSTNITISVL